MHDPISHPDKVADTSSLLSLLDEHAFKVNAIRRDGGGHGNE